MKTKKKRILNKCIFFCFFVFILKNRFHSNYHHHSGWNPPDTPPESVTNVPTTLNSNHNHNTNNNNNNNTSGVSIGATNITNTILAATTNSAIAYRDGQFFEQNCHVDSGSPNGSLSPPSVIGTHSGNHLTNYRSHMAYYQA